MKDSLTKDDLRKIMAVGGKKCASFRCHRNAASDCKYCDSHEQGRINRQREIDLRFSLTDTKDCPGI